MFILVVSWLLVVSVCLTPPVRKQIKPFVNFLRGVHVPTIGYKQDDAPRIVMPSNRFIVLKEKSQFLYDLKDMYFLPREFLNTFEILDSLADSDYAQYSSFYNIPDHVDYIQKAQIINTALELFDEGALFSINCIHILSQRFLYRIYNYEGSDTKIDKLLDELPTEYNKQFRNILTTTTELKQLTEFIFTDFVDLNYVAHLCSQDSERYTQMFDTCKREFDLKFKDIINYYKEKPIVQFEEYNFKKIQVTLMKNINQLIVKLPDTEIEKKIRLKSILKEITATDKGTSLELVLKIQKEVSFILEYYSMSLEKVGNKDSIEAQAFYNYLTYISNECT